MDRSVEEEISGSSTTDILIPFTQSVLGGIKRVIDFFVMSEDELSQAGIYLGYTDRSDKESQKNPPI